MNKLEKRIFEISYEHKLSHLSSNLSSVGIIDEIYSIKKTNEPFILSNGHAGLALYVVLEKYHNIDAEMLYLKHGVHPNRDVKNHIYYSSGSLGCGLPGAVGMALSNKDRDVYCLISDGELFEGSIYETFNLILKYNIENIKVYCNINGHSALATFDVNQISNRLNHLYPKAIPKITNSVYERFPFLSGIAGHYKTLTKEDMDYASTIL